MQLFHLVLLIIGIQYLDAQGIQFLIIFRRFIWQFLPICNLYRLPAAKAPLDIDDSDIILSDGSDGLTRDLVIVGSEPSFAGECTIFKF